MKHQSASAWKNVAMDTARELAETIAEVRSILERIAGYGPPQGEKPAGTACAFCDMGGAGYSSRGDGFRDDACAVKDAQLFIAKLEGK